MWSDMKSFIRSKLCASKNEIIKEAREYLKTLSEEKCKNFIAQLKRVFPSF